MTRLFPVLFLLACNGGTATIDGQYPPPDPLPAELTECTEEADCVAVELGCCDSCNGGVRVAASRDQEQTVIDVYSETCPPIQCTEIGCDLPQAVCRNNRCELR